MRKLFKIKLTTTRIIAFGFAIGILLGGILLHLPLASKTGEAVSFVDSLFVATTCLCVTGLTPVVTSEQWSYFGQTVMLFLMQFGGLGVVTFTTSVLMMLGKRISLADRMLIQDSYNLDSVAGVVKLTRRIIKGTLIVEGIGAVFYSFVFIPQFGVLDGIWKSVWHAVSAFCNAGLDTVDPSGFLIYQTNVLINITTMLLIIVAGIGFPVWWDIVRVAKEVARKEILLRDAFRKTMLHTKLAVTATLVLLFGGAVLILVFEYNNPATIGNLTFGQKVMASMFESTTLRTAGFQTIDQADLTGASSILAMLLMFIGGSPSGTAGGVKTVTFVILFLAMLSSIRGNEEVTAFRRKISDDFVKRALTVVMSSFFVLVTMSIVLSAIEDFSALDILFEVVSGLATVGLTRGITGSLSTVSKYLIILTMYLGRIGPITMALAFNAKKYQGKKSLAEGKVIIG